MEFKDNKIKGIGFIIALICISLLITGLIIIAFLFSDNRFVITKSIITLLYLLVIVQSCRFDEIHFGHLFEVSRKANVEIQKITSEETTRNEFFMKCFSPAMNNNLLQIEKVLYTKNEYDSCLEEIKSSIRKNKINNKR